MAAGLGFKDFTTGEVLTAADVDGYLMQGIWVFANAAARDAAVTSPQEGNACYLKDTDVIQVYTGSAWAAQSAFNPISANIVDAKGDLIVGTAADTVSRLAVGANNTVLTADSSTATGLKWATPAGGGKVLQVVSATYSTQTTTTGITYTDTGLSTSITPTLSSSKVLVLVNQPLCARKDSGVTSVGSALRIMRNSTAIYEPATGRYQMNFFEIGSGTAEKALDILSTMVYLDSPATTSSTTYKTQIATYNSGSDAISNRGNSVATITLLEIGA